MMAFRLVCRSIPAFALVLVAACGGGGSGSTSTSTGAGGASTSTGDTGSTGGAGGAMATSTTGSGEPMCDLPLYPDRPACQTRMDGACCAEEKDCGADPDCVTLVDCFNACPTPKDEPCLNTCALMALKTSVTKIDAIGHCSSMHPQLPDQSCAYP
jgi:hypothetical protein